MDSSNLFGKQDDSNLSTGDARSGLIYDSSNLGVEDDYSNNTNAYDSYNEMSGSSSEEEDENERPFSHQTTPFRFINGKDGMATCERCGAVGVKHAFYSKSKRFCSLSCSRSFATAQREVKPQGTKQDPANVTPPGVPVKKVKSQGKIPQAKPEDYIPRTKTTRPGGVKGFDWGPYLSSNGFDSASVSCFKHCPMFDSWHNITTGMKVEVQNYECDVSVAYWIATVIKLAGYKALMRYEGYGGDSSTDFWVNLCTQDVHPVGWCATEGKPLVPPKSIQSKYIDWKEYLVKRLTGSRTLPNTFFNKVVESISSHGFKEKMRVEVVDKMCVSAMRVANVEEIVGGRLRLQYADTKEEDDFWCHCRSSLVHHVGWAQQSGHKLHATQAYRNRCLEKIAMEKYDANDATPVLFPKIKDPPNGLKFQVGMKLEAIDPLNLSAICVASVMKVLKNNYLMIGIDGSMAENGSDWFCYAASSPCIFPVGFCEINGIDLTPPRGHKGPFRWFDYLKQTKSVAAPVKLFDKEIPKHGFKSGMKVEAVDLMEPRQSNFIIINPYEVDEQVELPPVPKIVKEAKKRKGKPVHRGPKKNKKVKKPRLPGFPLMEQLQGQHENSRGQELISYRSQPHPARAPLSPDSVASALPPLVDPNSKMPTTSTPKSKADMDISDNSLTDGPPTLSPKIQSAEVSQPNFPIQATVKQEPMDDNETNKKSSSSPNGKTALSQLLQSKSMSGGGSGQGTGGQISLLANRQVTIPPPEWTVSDVCYFLKSHDCASYCESFVKMGIDGKKLLDLTREQIVNLTGMRVGASLKISDLIQKMKSKLMHSVDKT
ncbi:hypothetical protein FSP39_013414 [Pinctada imbricata]|uniref:Uncharacterized protein n=1 Tax=Pinctada imbricata TaxID=66713 RepID=A0AA88YE23_PINIB|nr:hypothetical protein FSP39_013414 [Pinctada imbricata]